MSTSHQGTLDDFLGAYAADDREALSQMLADDVSWHVGGQHRFSGTYRGRDAVLTYFGEVADATADSLTLHPVEVMAGQQRGAAFVRVTGERDGEQLDVLLAEALTFDDDGRITQFWATANDQSAIDRFWGVDS